MVHMMIDEFQKTLKASDIPYLLPSFSQNILDMQLVTAGVLST